MKQQLTFLLCALAGYSFSQQDKSWSLGAQWGFHGSHSEYSAGMEEASSRFQHNAFGGVALGLVARYDVSRHWMFTGGLSIYTYGFDFALAENYSLRAETRRFSSLGNEYAVLELPTMVYYKFNPDCRNRKWVIGLGLVRALSGAKTSSGYYSGDAEANPEADYLKVESSSKDVLNPMIRLDISREKLLKHGGILNAALVLNAGFEELATAQVSYQVDGRHYDHTFINRGNFIGFRATYFFRPFSVKPKR